MRLWLSEVTLCAFTRRAMPRAWSAPMLSRSCGNRTLALTGRRTGRAGPARWRSRCSGLTGANHETPRREIRLGALLLCKRPCVVIRLIVCGDAPSRGVNPSADGIRCLRRQSPRPASPDRMGFAYDPDPPADRQLCVKGDSDLSAVKAIRDLSAVRRLLCRSAKLERAGRHCSSDAFGRFCGRRLDCWQN
jgi:hypothetical protein